MTSYVLEITLRTPLTSAAGEGRVGLVDRDVVFDDQGLPILPGRRIKGLWSEAYQEVVDAWTLCGQDAVRAQRIFGQTGQAPGAGAALMRVGDACLREAPMLEPWLAYLQHRPGESLRRNEVVQCFAVVRAQTAIDRQTGAPREDTLRLTRTLRPGLVFHAPLRFAHAPNAAVLRALALGAAALQHMGTARTRGLGEVKCRLLAVEEHGKPVDLTAQAVVEDHPRHITIAGNSETPNTQMDTQDSGGSPLSGHAPTHLLRYRLTLTAPAVIPVADGDPNTIVTRRDIPGSILWGCAAWHYLRQPGHAPHDTAFRQAFLDGELRFLSALPESLDDEQQRLVPAPHSIRQSKHTRELVDFVENFDTDEPLKRVTGRYTRIMPGSVETQRVKTQLNYHHARATDRRIGRVLGAEAPEGEGGAFFVYEALESGQRFQGAVLGQPEWLFMLKTWLQGVEYLSIGRSRSAQYGGEALLEWLDDAPVALSVTDGEWVGFRASEEDVIYDEETSSLPPTERLVITTLSLLLAVNTHGHPEARFPQEELAAALGVDAGDLQLLQSYTRTEQIGGFIAHLRLPRQQWPAIAPGSVFVFDVSKTQNRITSDNLRQLEYDGLGLRKGEGYGRLAVNRHGHLRLTGTAVSELDDPAKQPSPEAPITSSLPDEVQTVLRHVVCQRCQASFAQDAMKIAQDMSRDQLPGSTLLGRLDLIIRQPRTEEAAATLGKLRKPAITQLQNCRVPNVGVLTSSLKQGATLYDLFTQALAHPHTIGHARVTAHAQDIVEDRYMAIREAIIAALVEHESENLVIGFLHTLLGAMRWRLKTPEVGIATEQWRA